MEISMWAKIISSILTGVPKIIDAIANARRKKREQKARLKKEAKAAEAKKMKIKRAIPANPYDD